MSWIRYRNIHRLKYNIMYFVLGYCIMLQVYSCKVIQYSINISIQESRNTTRSLQYIATSPRHWIIKMAFPSQTNSWLFFILQHNAHTLHSKMSLKCSILKVTFLQTDHIPPYICIYMLLTVNLYTPLQVTMETLSQQYIIYHNNNNWHHFTLNKSIGVVPWFCNTYIFITRVLYRSFDTTLFLTLSACSAMCYTWGGCTTWGRCPSVVCCWCCSHSTSLQQAQGSWSGLVLI